MKKKKGKSKINTIENQDASFATLLSSMPELYPAFDKNNVAICFSSSNVYAPILGVLIQSISEHISTESNYDMVIFSKDITDTNKMLLKSIIMPYANMSIRFYDISEIASSFSFYTWAHFTAFTYYRLLAPYVFHNYEKVIYLDCDTVVNRDIAELYNTDLGDNYAAAARDTHVVSRCISLTHDESRSYYVNELKLQNPQNYFQCGVLLLNIKKLLEKFPNGWLIQEGSRTSYRWMDQDLMNVNFQNHVKIIPNIWNVMIFNTPQRIDEELLPPGDIRDEYFAARENPAIIHYVGHSIPCFIVDADMFWHFWRYARKTPFYEYLLALSNDHRRSFVLSHFRDNRSFARKFADRFLPKDSKRRNFLKSLMPKGSRRWKFCKRVYCLLVFKKYTES